MRTFIHYFAGLLIVIVGVVIYANSIHVPFIFDDSQNVAFNEHLHLKELSPQGLYEAAFESPLPSRAVANLSFALNYYWSGEDPLVGMHVVNILIHVVSGLLVYALCLLWMRVSSEGVLCRDPWSICDTRRQLISAIAALVFVAHPVHSQSVTYVVQRMASLAVMFYLLALVLYCLGRLQRDSLRRNWCLVGVLVFWGLSLGCKEIAITLPLIVALMEWLLFSKSPTVPRMVGRRLKWQLVCGGVALLLAVVVICLVSRRNPLLEVVNGYRFRDFTMAERLWTQARVVVFYLSLLFYPHPSRLNLIHYIFPPVSGLASVGTAVSLLVLSSLIGWAVYFLRSRPLYTFCIFWFFGQLLLESTMMPLEMIFEHRLYLPSVGIILLFVLLVDTAWGRCRRVALFAVWAVVLGAMMAGTIARNQVWQDVIGLWTDVIVKSPMEPRGWNNRGKEYVTMGLSDETIRDEYLEKGMQDYKIALGRAQHFVEVLNNLGNLYVELGQRQPALAYLTKAIELRKGMPIFCYNRAVAFEQFNDLESAIADYTHAITINDEFAGAYFNRGVVLGQIGETRRAIDDFSRVIALQSDNSAAYLNRGDAHMQLGQLNLALRDFDEVIRLDPDMAQAYYNRAGTYSQLGEAQQALQDYNRAIEIGDLDLAYYNRGNIYMNREDYVRAIEDFSKAIEKNPLNTGALNNRALCYMGVNDVDKAFADFDRAIKSDPKSAIVYVCRGNAHLMLGNHTAAQREYNRALALSTDIPQAYFNRGQARAALGNHTGAVRDFGHAIRLLPQDSQNYHRRAQSLYHLGQFEAAQRDVDQCQQMGGKVNAGLLKAVQSALQRSPRGGG